MEIICKGDEVVVWVNGDLVNHGYDATVESGKIAIQAEGSEVEFRRIDLYPWSFGWSFGGVPWRSSRWR